MSYVPQGRSLTFCLSSQSWHPPSFLDYLQVEAYRASKTCALVLLFTACIDKIQHVTPVCYRRNCIISAYYQQRETHKPAPPNVSINQCNSDMLFPSLWKVNSPAFPTLPFFTGSGKLLRSPNGSYLLEIKNDCN